LCRKITEAAPADFAGNYLLAIICLQQGQYQEARERAVTALKSRPGAHDVLMVKGLAERGAGHLAEALASFDLVTRAKPDFAKGLFEQGLTLLQLNREAEALSCFDRAAALDPNHARASDWRGVALWRLGRGEEALAACAGAIALQPGDALAWTHHGVVLSSLGRLEASLASYARALALRPGDPDILIQRGKAFLALERHAEALDDFKGLLARKADDPDGLMHCGIALWHLDRAVEAVDCHDRALARDGGNAQIHYHRANALRDLERPAEAEAGYRRALVLQPGHDAAHYNLGAVLCEQGRVTEAFEVFTHWSNTRDEGKDGSSPISEEFTGAQAAYRAGAGLAPASVGRPHLEGGDRLAGPAIGAAHAGVTEQWHRAHPQIAVLDDFLAPEALEALRRFCWGSTIWRKPYKNYLGAFPEHGICCPLLAQIAEELAGAYPAIFRGHPLLYAWGFNYGSEGSGTPVHADFAAVNVNFWITPDEANRDPESGGLTIWDVAAPADWDFAQYNSKPSRIRRFLADSGAKPIRVPYRANRAVIFDSDLFHETEAISFRPGHTNRRINMTLLYGRRG
jgi:tetratricopeptide (TPR) repeat protein